MNHISANLHELSNAQRLKNAIIIARIKCAMPKCNQIDVDKLKKIFCITDIPDQETAQTELDNLNKLNEYLCKSQNDKYYLLWKNEFKLIQSNNDDYIMTNIIGISNNNSLILKNKNGN